MNNSKWLSLLLIGCIALTGCLDSDDDDDDADDDPIGDSGELGAVTVPSTAINAALTYMDESLPEYGSASTVAYTKAQIQRFLVQSSRSWLPISTAHAAATATAGDTLTATNWDSTSTANKIFPPGGFPQTNETYPDSTDPVVYVSLKEHIGKQLDADFARESGDGGAFKPTLFGRFDSAINIINVLAAAVPDGFEAGEQTIYITMDNQGTPTAAEEEDEGAIAIELDIVDISDDSTLYDLALRIVSEPMDLEVWVWLKNTTAVLNFQQLEYDMVDHEDDDSIPESAGEITRMSTVTLNWNRTSGEMLFEYVSVDDDAATQANGSAMRMYVEEEGGDSYLVGFEGDTAGDATRNTYSAFSIVSTGGDEAVDALLSLNIKTNAEDQSGFHVSGSDFCVSMQNGDPITSGGCTGLDDNGLSLTSSFPAFITNVIAVDEADDIVDRLGVGTWTDSDEPNLGSAPQFTGASDIASGFAAP